MVGWKTKPLNWRPYLRIGLEEASLLKPRCGGIEFRVPEFRELPTPATLTWQTLYTFIDVSRHELNESRFYLRLASP